MNEENNITEYHEIIDGMDRLLDGRGVDAIIPALVCVLAEVLAETRQDKGMALAFISDSIDTAYNSRNDEEH